MAWRNILALGLLASAAFAGCTVTTDDPGDDDGGSGGSSSGGAKATGGKASTGGKSSTGGSSSGGAKVDSGPATCSGADNACSTCIQDNCCQEWHDCGNDSACSQKPNDEGELLCIQDCLIDQVGDAAPIEVQECAGRCAVDSSGVSEATSALIACIRAPGEADDGGVVLQACSIPCFGTELP